MHAAILVALSLAAGIASASGERGVAEGDAAFIARTISASPMTPNERVKARLTDCSLVIDRTVPAEKKRLVVPLARLDEGSFEVVQDSEWGWFVEMHTQQRRPEIVSSTVKRTDRLTVLSLHIYDQKNAQSVRAA